MEPPPKWSDLSPSDRFLLERVAQGTDAFLTVEQAQRLLNLGLGERALSGSLILSPAGKALWNGAVAAALARRTGKR